MSGKRINEKRNQKEKGKQGAGGELHRVLFLLFLIDLRGFLKNMVVSVVS